MIKKNLRMITAINIASDGLLIFISYFFALTLRFDVLDGKVSIALTSRSFVFAAIVYSVCTVMAYYVLRLYSMERFKSKGNETLIIFLVNVLGSLVSMSILFLLRISDFSRLALGLFWVLSSSFVSIKHAIVRHGFIALRKHGRNLMHMIIVGSGAIAEQYAQDIRSAPYLGMTIDGYVGNTQNHALGTYFGRYDDIYQILEAHDSDELVAALEPDEIQYMQKIIDAADKEGRQLSLIPFFSSYIPCNPTIETIGQTKLIDMRAMPLDHIGWAAIKRMLDIVGSLLLIIVFSPVMLAVAIGVKMSSPGPVLFRQERVGKNKKPFKMLKFRSMYVTSTENTGWSTKKDPRKTKFGAFIRKYSLDELPQFFNVLKGDMSLVGPRPEVPYHIQHFKEDVPLYLLRQQVRPGITGWAQVNGLRGDTSIEARVTYDLWYIQNWTIGLDIRILLRTALGGMKNDEQM